MKYSTESLNKFPSLKKVVTEAIAKREIDVRKINFNIDMEAGTHKKIRYIMKNSKSKSYVNRSRLKPISVDVVKETVKESINILNHINDEEE